MRAEAVGVGRAGVGLRAKMGHVGWEQAKSREERTWQRGNQQNLGNLWLIRSGCHLSRFGLMQSCSDIREASSCAWKA